MEPEDPFIDSDHADELAAGVRLACGLLEADVNTMVDLVFSLDDEDVCRIALAMLASQHPGYGGASLESLFGDTGVVLDDLFRIRQLRGQVEILGEFVGGQADSPAT